MTSNHEQDAFEHRFEHAVNDAHERLDRGVHPSKHVWRSIRAGIPDMRAETADPRATASDPAPVSRRTQQMRKEADMDTALNPRLSTSPPNANRGLFAWVALALVATLLASVFFLNGQTPPPDNDNELAWAPGLGTPDSSPIAQADESVCSTEPLTTEEVLETVLNPNQGYRRLASEQAENDDSLWEPPLAQEPEFWHQLNLQPVDDPERAEELVAMGNEFLGCLQHGTAYQVWAFLDPIVLQKSIINQFPVLRSEADLRAYIDSVGPQLFVDADESDLAALMRFNASKPLMTLEEDDALQFVDGTDRLHFPYGVGIIRIGAPEFSSLEFEMYVTEVSPGIWVVNDIGSLVEEE